MILWTRENKDKRESSSVSKACQMISCRMEKQQFPLENHYFCHAFEALFCIGTKQVPAEGNETPSPHPQENDGF